MIIGKDSVLKPLPCNLKQLSHLASCLIPSQVIACARRVFGGIEPGASILIRLREFSPLGCLIEQGIQQFTETERAASAGKRPRGIGMNGSPDESTRMARA